MEAGEFADHFDNWLEQFERQAENDPMAARNLAEMKAEFRRRLLEKSVWERLFSTPVEVEVEKIDLKDLIPTGSYDTDFHAVPIIVTTAGNSLTVVPGNTDPVEPIHRSVGQGFFSEAEARAFLAGLQTARVFGLPFKSIPDLEDIADNAEPYFERIAD